MSAVMEEKKSRAAGLLTSQLRLKRSVYEVSLLHPGGSLLHPGGSLLHPGGSLLHPGHPEGSLLHPGHPEGSLLHPEGSLLHPGHPGGSLLHPGGSLLHPGGSLLHPGGSLLHPGGSLLHPGGSLLHPGHPEGSLLHPEGSLLHPGHPGGSLLHPGLPGGALLHPGHPGGALLLRWRKAQQPFKLGVGHSVPVSEVIAVRALDAVSSSTTTGTSRRTSRQKSSRRWKKIPQRDEEDSTHAFTVSYVERTRQPGWRCRDVTFVCPEAALCSLWVRTLTEQISALANRPRRLLVYINPYSGKKRGERIYQHKVAPLFSRADIATHVIVTEHANHARDHLRTEAELQNYDGVVCVGGDGMFSEVMHGLVWRTQSDHGRDHTSPDQTLAPTALRIGIIPAGSTDCICFATVGANDPVTSALHIIVGDCQPMDVCSVHHNDTFLRYSVSLLGYGFYGDVLSDSERKRWMGPARYDISGVKTFLSHQYYEGTVSYLPASDALGTPRDRTPCRTGCVVCQHNRPLEEKEENHKMEESDDGGAWRSVRGKFLAINAVSMSCACPRSPQGLSPAAHLADGTTDLILVRKCSRLAFLRHLLRHTSKEDQFDLSFVEVHRVRRFHFTPRFCQSDSALDLEELLLEKEVQEKEVAGSQAKRILGQICREHPACCLTSSCSSCWNCDGEILPHAAIQVRAHRQLIQLFARGIEETHVFDDITSP